MLHDLTAQFKRLALVGLAKNTGKTVTLATLLRESQAAGRRVGVTSVGRDGEERDVIDFRIEKPRIELPGGSLVATTDALLRASGIPHELLEQTGVRTPLGRVLVARLRGGGPIEVAGPSGAEQVRAVSDAMLAHGAEQVLIDGAIDRRAASSPDVADALVMATGAVLSEDISEVVRQTVEAVELVRLRSVDAGTQDGQRLRALSQRDAPARTPLADEQLEAIMLPARFALSAGPEHVAQMLDDHQGARWLIVPGALPERFLHQLVQTARKRRRKLVVIVANSTRVFLAQHGPRWFRQQGIEIETFNPICLTAITVNPLAPRSHRFDSIQLRELLKEAIAGVPILDVLNADYTAAGTLAQSL